MSVFLTLWTFWASFNNSVLLSLQACGNFRGEFVRHSQCQFDCICLLKVHPFSGSKMCHLTTRPHLFHQQTKSWLSFGGYFIKKPNLP